MAADYTVESEHARPDYYIGSDLFKIIIMVAEGKTDKKSCRLGRQRPSYIIYDHRIIY